MYAGSVYFKAGSASFSVIQMNVCLMVPRRSGCCWPALHGRDLDSTPAQSICGLHL